jgi:hypothetical protein
VGLGLELRGLERSTSLGTAGFSAETPTAFIQPENKARVRLYTFVDIVTGCSVSNHELVDYEFYFGLKIGKDMYNLWFFW